MSAPSTDSQTSARPLLGRVRETEILADLLTSVEEQGAATMVCGGQGIGKSALLDEAAAEARRRDMQVLCATGVQSEGHLPYAGLHQLMRPLLGRHHRLAAPQRGALVAAFGMEAGGVPDVFLTAVASLNLLAEAAAETPLLLLVDDAHWLDSPSADVLAFVARRIDSDPIVLLATSREGSDGPLDRAGLPELSIEALDQASAAALLDSRAPDLPGNVRERLLDEAAGNPLALVELPIAWASQSTGATTSLPTWLPLTTRLEHAFAARVSELPVATRTLLLVAAVDDGGILGEILQASASVSGESEATVELLEPAVAAGLILLERETVRFRHSLARSAIRQAASVSQLHVAHSALAEALADQPSRRVWHRAAACVAPDEQVSAELEDAALSAKLRGAIDVAQWALERAAELSVDSISKGRRLVGAAQLAHELGRRDTVVRLLRQAEPLELGPLERARVSWLRETLYDAAWSGDGQIRSFVEIANQLRREGDPDEALSCLLAVGLRLGWSNPDQATRDLVVAAAERIPVEGHDPALLAVLANADPVKCGALVIDRISKISPDPGDPAAMYLIGSAATAAWAYDLALEFLDPAVDGLREQDRLGLLVHALVSQAWAALHLAKESLAGLAAEEAARLARESGQPRWELAAQLALATLAGERGDLAGAERLIQQAEATLMPAGANPMLALAQFARGRGAVAHQLYPEGFDQLSRLLDPDDIAYHPFVGAWALSDLVEAAVHLGKRESAAVYLAELEWLVAATGGPLLRAELGYARPLVTDDSGAEALYQDALASDLKNWPCYRGRLLLAYGRWLRRRRRVAESRAPLRAARETFDALSFHKLAESARQELRASGETGRRRTPDARDELTPQELQIAEMAATGMSNKEIGQTLYLSHRTVGSHLYRMFPKLGISSRSELRDALSPRG